MFALYDTQAKWGGWSCGPSLSSSKSVLYLSFEPGRGSEWVHPSAQIQVGEPESDRRSNRFQHSLALMLQTGQGERVHACVYVCVCVSYPHPVTQL